MEIPTDIIYDLDENEKIETIKICHTQYQVGDIPIFIKEKLENIKTGWFINKEKQCLKIIKELLLLRNDNVSIDNWSNRNIESMIIYIKKRIADDQKYLQF